MTPSPPPYKCPHCRDQKFVGGYDGGPGSGQAEPCPRCNYTPPPALVEKVARDVDPTWWSWCDGLLPSTRGGVVVAAGRSARLRRVEEVLVASGMGALVALIERVGALQKSSANPELIPIIDDARALLRKIEGGE